MLWTIAVILTVLWLLGLVSSYTMGGLIHLLSGDCHCHGPGSDHSRTTSDVEK